MTLEKNVPLKPRRKSGGRKPKYPFKSMEIGDSFFCAEPRSIIHAAVSMYKKKHGGEWSVRIDVKENITGFRVWKIS